MAGFDFHVGFDGSENFGATDRVPPPMSLDELEDFVPLPRARAADGTQTDAPAVTAAGEIGSVGEVTGEIVEQPSQAWLEKIASVCGDAPVMETPAPAAHHPTERSSRASLPRPRRPSAAELTADENEPTEIEVEMSLLATPEPAATKSATMPPPIPTAARMARGTLPPPIPSTNARTATLPPPIPRMRPATQSPAMAGDEAAPQTTILVSASMPVAAVALPAIEPAVDEQPLFTIDAVAPTAPAHTPLADLLEPSSPVMFVDESALDAPLAANDRWIGTGTQLAAKPSSPTRIAVALAVFGLVIGYAAFRHDSSSATPAAMMASMGEPSSAAPPTAPAPAAEPTVSSIAVPQPAPVPAAPAPAPAAVAPAAPALTAPAPAVAPTPVAPATTAAPTVDTVAAQVAVAPKPQPVIATKPAASAHIAAAPTHATATAPAPKRVAIATQAPKPAPTAAAPPVAKAGQGILMISTKPPCEIVVDGKPTHLITPQRSLALSPGTHQVTLVNNQQKIHKVVAVNIDAHHPTKLIQDFMKK